MNIYRVKITSKRTPSDTFDVVTGIAESLQDASTKAMSNYSRRARQELEVSSVERLGSVDFGKVSGPCYADVDDQPKRKRR